MNANNDEVKQHWISVDDQLPEIGSLVLATDGEIITIVQRITTENFLRLVTHWMPLPAPPAQGDKS